MMLKQVQPIDDLLTFILQFTGILYFTPQYLELAKSTNQLHTISLLFHNFWNNLLDQFTEKQS